jgi:acetoin utilization deacetylase AcuC-like enzyme
VGRGAGEGFNVNLPVPPGSGDAEFCGLVDGVVVPLALEFEPSLVLVSAGFDAHTLDPLASCDVSTEGYAEMTASLRRVCADLDVPLGLVLEGGYSIEALVESVCELMPVLGAPGVPAAAAGSASRPAIVGAAREFHSRWWPVLGTSAA